MNLSSGNPPLLSLSSLISAARECGLEIVGVLDLEDAQQVLDAQKEYLQQWQARGWSGEMSYMQRPAELLTNLRNLLPEVRSIVSFVVPYSTAEDIALAQQPCPIGFGRVARYAWGRDYHRVLPKRMKRLVNEIQARHADGKKLAWRVFSDAVPLLERALVVGSRLGFFGKNTMVIRPGHGSFSFLCEVLWNVEVHGDVVISDQKASCGSCIRCLELCPTNALPNPYQLDARRCISYLTIEKRGSFDDWEQQALGEWLFGCDVCQTVCPFNHQGVANTFSEEFAPQAGCGPFLDLTEVLQISDRAAFVERFAGTPLMRAGREGLLRNAACVAANTKAVSCSGALAEAALHDSSALIRQQARNALRQLSPHADGAEKRRIDRVLSQ